MVTPSAKQVFIQGITQDGRTFRPSDWAERLAGVMCSFRPGGPQPGSHLSYSPWCVPTIINGIKSALPECEIILQVMNPVTDRPEGEAGWRHGICC